MLNREYGSMENMASMENTSSMENMAHLENMAQWRIDVLNGENVLNVENAWHNAENMRRQCDEIWLNEEYGSQIHLMVRNWRAKLGLSLGQEEMPFGE